MTSELYVSYWNYFLNTIWMIVRVFRTRKLGYNETVLQLTRSMEILFELLHGKQICVKVLLVPNHGKKRCSACTVDAKCRNARLAHFTTNLHHVVNVVLLVHPLVCISWAFQLCAVMQVIRWRDLSILNFSTYQNFHGCLNFLPLNIDTMYDLTEEHLILIVLRYRTNCCPILLNRLFFLHEQALALFYSW